MMRRTFSARHIVGCAIRTNVEAGQKVLKGEVATAGGEARLRATLYDADGDDHDLELDAIDPSTLTERQLLWVDVEDDDNDEADPALRQLVQRFELDEDVLQLLQDASGAARLQNFGGWFLAQVIAVEHAGQLRFKPRPLAIVCGRNFVISVHRGPITFIEQLRDRERADTALGSLSAESFTASLLDWVVESYLHAVSDFEVAVDRLEVTLLGHHKQRNVLPELAVLRRSASRLRRMLSAQRSVFGALARPDFRPDEDGVADKHFRSLEQRYQRAMDAVDNTRELVVGSFELFTTRTAQRTNETMRVLTFVTVLLGSLAVIAGVMGMNFKAKIFDLGEVGFWTTVAVMAGIILVATGVARWRRWL
jgi:magnesium transporter